MLSQNLLARRYPCIITIIFYKLSLIFKFPSVYKLYFSLVPPACGHRTYYSPQFSAYLSLPYTYSSFPLFGSNFLASLFQEAKSIGLYLGVIWHHFRSTPLASQSHNTTEKLTPCFISAFSALLKLPSGTTNNTIQQFIQDCAFGGSREQFSGLGGVLFSLQKSKISRFFKLENFQRMLKKSMKNL